MAVIPKVICCLECPACPALPLSRKQYDDIVKSAKEDPDESNRRVAQSILRMEVMLVYCLKEEASVYMQLE